jgi:glycosyltransferase involved in cell wall biosynthesis
MLNRSGPTQRPSRRTRSTHTDPSFMIGIVHGYGLAGAGSNLWTREIVAALCGIGETVHLMCQERHPERFRFIAELWTYENGLATRIFERDTPAPGRCILHKPRLEVLPTYVRPDRKSEYVRSILDLPDDAIEEYLGRNLVALRSITEAHGIHAWHVNHAVLLSECARRLRGERGTRYAVMPHGSALEYIIRHDERMQKLAYGVFREADAVFALNQEVRDRLDRFFPDLELDAKTRTVRVGVDTELFRPVPRGERGRSVQRLADALADTDRGHRPEHAARVRQVVRQAREDDLDPTTLHERLRPAADYTTALPDLDLEDRLGGIDWDAERVVAFVGRLLPAKGVAALVVAFPRILERHPGTRLLLVGAGWLREYLEAFVLALSEGCGPLALRILEAASERSQEGARPSATAFLHGLRDLGRYDDYVDRARHALRPDHVLFTGFLAHPLLAHVFPLADVAVFPSAVAEASPLVIPESAACGCLPMGTDFAGMRRRRPPSLPHVHDGGVRSVRYSTTRSRARRVGKPPA